MILILEVTSAQGAKPVVRRQEFTEQGGIIGRGNESFWVLPHSKVSGRHAVISCRNAVFYIEDTSTNGVCINSTDNRLVRGRPYALKSGDHILIEPYEIDVSIVAESDEASRRPLGDSSEIRSSGGSLGGSNPFGGDDPFAQRGGSLIDSSIVTPPSEAMGQELDPLKLLDPSPRFAPVRKAPAPGVKDLGLGSVMDEHYRPPAALPAPMPPQREAALIPPGYDPLAPDDSAVLSAPVAPPPVERVSRSSQAVPDELPPIAPEPASAAASPTPAPQLATDASGDAVGAVDLAAMLAGAGLSGAAVTPELARNFGRILRVVVSGLMDVLQARQQIKQEFWMDVTHFRPAANNPLKFSANVDDALHNLLVKRNAAYLAPVEAFADAFEDLRNHQMAMLAGMRVAFESMLAEFDPDRLQEQFDRQPSRGALLRVPAQLRYWDLYRDKCRDIVKDPEVSFRTLFGEEFARAYEEQLERLKAEGAPGPKKGRR